MKDNIFKTSLILVALLFTIIFFYLMIPPISENPDIIGAFAAGFVNPFAAGYATDAVCCWLILLIWVIYEYPKVKYGWLCVLIGIIPGVAVGLALYIILRMNQLKSL